MPYISELLDDKVTDSSDSVAGNLEDVLITHNPGNFAPLEFLVIKTFVGKQIKFVPYEYVVNFTSSDITLKSIFNNIALDQLPKGNFVYLKRDIMDRQIVDISGTRVVRVNDLRIGNFDNKVCVLAIDSSFRGLLRRLGFADSLMVKPFQVHLIDWRNAEFLDNGPLQINTSSEHLGRLHPADLANIVEDLDVKQGSKLLTSLDEKEAAKVLEEVEPGLQNILVKYLGPDKASKILAQMSTDEFVDLIKTFSEPEARLFLSQVGSGKQESIRRLISYPDNTAGGLMTLDFITVRPDWTVAQATEEVKKASENLRSIVYLYVVDEAGKFYGVVSLRRLLVSPPEALIRKLNKPLVIRSSLKPGDKIERVIKLMTKYNLYTAAVLDKEKKLVGIVTIDDVMRHLFPAA